MVYTFLKYLSTFVFWYPLIMSLLWIVGGLLFRTQKETKNLPELEETPLVSILIACYNEEATIEDTIDNLQHLKYPNYEIIVVNDGSKDNTSDMLRTLHNKYQNVRVIDLKTNRGKANALYLALIASKGEIVVGIDADAALDPNALNYMIPHFTSPQYGERVGAVTGNPRIRNRSSLLSKIQIAEFSSIIGLIKRSQRMLGKVMTVSGVIVAFRKRALLQSGLWDRDMITEDIAVSWKLQRNFWDIRYEPRAICWMLVPETIRGLWNQRVRWAQGGLEVMFRHWDIFLDLRQRRIFLVYLEQLTSVIWSFSWFILTIVYFVILFLDFELSTKLIPLNAYLSVLSLVQFFVALIVDRKYDKSILKYYLWVPWYPIFYWYFNALVVLRAFPKALFKGKGKFAVWESPDRGI